MRIKLAIIVLISSMLINGCAEFRNRGGMTDWLEDRFFFKADTKGLRVIRSYTIVAGLSRIAGKSPFSIEERREVATKIENAISLNRDAFECAFADKHGPYGCIFFDDIMSQLDGAIIRLARIIFLPEENKDLLAVLQKEMIGGDIPSNLFGAAAKIVQAAGEVGTVGGQSANIIGSLIELGRTAMRFGGRLTPLYRDTAELQMRIVLDGLAGYMVLNAVTCGAIASSEIAPPKVQIATVRNAWTASPSLVASMCEDYSKTEALFGNASTGLNQWTDHAQEMFQKYNNILAPRKSHFVQVSALIIRGCAGILGGSSDADKCSRIKKGGSSGVVADQARGLIFPVEAHMQAWTPDFKYTIQ